MKLLPADCKHPSDWEDGLWFERPGYPWYEGSWIHPPPEGHVLPEFEFEEGHDLTKNRAPPVLVVGSGNDAQVRQLDARIPRRQCQLLKLGRGWWLEGISARHPVYCKGQVLGAADRVQLKDQDMFSLLPTPSALTFRILLNDEDNFYIDEHSVKDYPNKLRSMFPHRSAECKACPDELKRLAWQTDQMRKRSEEDQVRVSDWAAFSQHVKRQYLKHGIDCKPWVDTRRPHDEKPPSYVARPYPCWIADIVSKERPLPGVAADRALPFESSLALSGRQCAEPLQYHGGAPPRLEKLYDNPVATGPAVARSFVYVSPAEGSTGGAVASTARSGDAASKPQEDPWATFGGPWQGQRPQSPSSLAKCGGAHASSASNIMMSNGGPLSLGGIAGSAFGSRRSTRVERIEMWRAEKLQAAKGMSFFRWLEAVDTTCFLVHYYEALTERFDSVEQVIELYVKNNELQKTFFDDAGIRKLGHRRLFDKWFSDLLSSSVPDAE